MKNLSFLFAAGMLLFSYACKDEKTLPSCDGVVWEYESDLGPEYWSELCVDYTPCGGTVQSPVNIEGAVYDPSLADIPQTYNSTATHIVNKGHTVQFNYDAGSSIVVGGETYTLLQFHTHTHSEHALGGASFPMEMHFVHKNEATGKLAVIGVFVREGAENSFLKGVVDHLPATKDSTYNANDTFNVADIMPGNKSYFTYSGSLTTPPCSETVSWFVMENPIEASATQIGDFENLEHENHRPLQPVNGRTIKFHKG
jgi:carbonic anhydrase